MSEILNGTLMYRIMTGTVRNVFRFMSAIRTGWLAYRRARRGGLPSEQTYRDANGLILMCMYCRRTQRPSHESDQWDWVRAFAERKPARVTHGICKTCLALELPKALIRR